MKKLLIVGFLAVLTLSTNAQCEVEPRNAVEIGMGAGFGFKANAPVAQLRVGYNFSKVRIGYTQTMHISTQHPAVFELRGGYELGRELSNVSIVSHIGWAYVLRSNDVGDVGNFLSTGAELQVHLRPRNVYRPLAYIDLNHVNGHILAVIGIKCRL